MSTAEPPGYAGDPARRAPGERHLERVLSEFVEHYNRARPHRGIDLEVPVAYSTVGRFNGPDRVERADRLGGLLHEYRVAA